MRKRFLPVLLVLCMVLSMLPVAVASAAGTPTEPTYTVTIDDNSTLWGSSGNEAVKATTDDDKNVTIEVALDKLNSNKTAFESYLKDNNGYFRFGTGNTITAETDGAQLCLPIKIAIDGVTPTEVTCVRMNGTTNMDEANGGTSMSASYSTDKKTVSEWPVLAFAELTYNSSDSSVSWKNSTTPFALNTVGASKGLHTWTYQVTWKVSDTESYTKNVVIKITGTGANEAQEITEVNVTLPTTLTIGADLPTASTEGVAIASAKIGETEDAMAKDNLEITALTWKKGGATVAADAKVEAGEYTAEVTVAVKSGVENYKLADTKTININSAAATEYKVTVTDQTVTAPTATFSNIDTETYDKLYEKDVTALGKFTVEADSKDSHKILVTGSANYISGWTQFSSIVEEQAGRYLPINIELDKVANVTITGTKTSTVTNLTEADKTIQLVMRLDDIAALEDTATVNKFTVTVAGDTTPYVVDISGLALLPEVKDDTEAGAGISNATKVDATSDDTKDELTTLIKETSTTNEDTTTEDAPVKVEVSGGNKTLTFDGTVGVADGQQNEAHKVELSTGLASALSTGDTKADVKVNSSVGSITVPANALGGVSDNVTISVKKATTGSSVTNDMVQGTEEITADQKTAVVEAIKKATGVTVEAKKGATDDLVTAADNNIVTITIKVAAKGDYKVLCVSNGKVTSFGTKTAGDDLTITIASKHTSDYYPISLATATEDTKAALELVAEDAGAAEPPVTSGVTATWDSSATLNGVCDGTVKLSGLENGTAYIVRVTRGTGSNAVNVYVNVQSDGSGNLGIPCQADAMLELLKASDGESVWTASGAANTLGG